MKSTTFGCAGVVVALLGVACGEGSMSPSTLAGPSSVSPSTAPSRIDRSCAVPGAPVGLVVTFLNEQPVLKWGAVAGATDYVVMVGTTPGGFDVIFTNSTQTSYPLGSLEPGRYHARVHAHNWCGASDPSTEVELTIV